MSSQFLRRILVGSLVTAFLSLGVPVSAEAVEQPDAPSLWVLAWQWLADQLAPVEEGEPDAAVSEESGSDAGWMLDPNG